MPIYTSSFDGAHIVSATMDMRQIPTFLHDQDWRNHRVIENMADSYLRVYAARCRQALLVLPAKDDVLNCARFKRGLIEEVVSCKNIL